MSPEAQRIAIAEACGWKKSGKVSDGSQIGHYWWEKDGKANNDIPDYLSDLNAMHEAEKTLTDYQAEEYYQQLCKIGQTMDSAPIAEYTIHATAAQRAEAFLRTLGLWLDDPSTP